MKTEMLTDRYAKKITGILNCFDRITIQGTLRHLCYAEGMSSYLRSHNIRIFDYPKFVEPLREKIRMRAEEISHANGLVIEFIRKNNFRKEKRIKDILQQRGTQPGIVHIFSAMEPCASFRPWYDKSTGYTSLKYSDGKCLHYYFYFIDEELGLCYLRVPTWCPFRLQFYCNGHSILACQLDRAKIGYTLVENAFFEIDNMQRAHTLAEHFNIECLHKHLESFVQQFCPVVAELGEGYHWSLWQVEYSTDIIFRTTSDLQAIYPHLLETLIHSVKPENIATFLGQKLRGNYQGEMGNNLNVRTLGTRIKHTMGPVSIKLYDKHRRILRIETTVNDVSFFREYRDVNHRTGETETTWASMRKTIYNLHKLQELLEAANHRYLEFLSHIETPQIGVKELRSFTTSKSVNEHYYKGFNPLTEDDATLLRTLARGEFAISGLTSAAMRVAMPQKTSSQISRLLKRLRVHGILRKVGSCYKYYLTQFGRKIVALALRLREEFVIPQLAWSQTMN
jgi:hypothetical protein